MQLPDWKDVFKAVCARANGALRWGLPEPWVHAELYAELERRAASSGWIPFAKEIPYVTHCPVSLPKATNRDWRTQGAVKWVDLCLRTEAGDAWCWLEFKVRHAGEAARRRQAAFAARDAFRKDVVALTGLDAMLTADAWENPDRYTVAYWFNPILHPHVTNLRRGTHYCVAAYLELSGSFDGAIWGEDAVRNDISAWHSRRTRHLSCNLPEVGVSSPYPLPGGHTLLLCDWVSKQGAEDREAAMGRIGKAVAS